LALSDLIVAGHGSDAGGEQQSQCHRQTFNLGHCQPPFLRCLAVTARLPHDPAATGLGGMTCRPRWCKNLFAHSSIVMTLDVYGHLFRDGGDRTELAAASRLLLA
jgi:hypothetical protein